MAHRAELALPFHLSEPHSKVMNTYYGVMILTVPKSVSHAVHCDLRQSAHTVSDAQQVMYSKRCIGSDVQCAMLSINQPEAKQGSSSSSSSHI